MSKPPSPSFFRSYFSSVPPAFIRLGKRATAPSSSTVTGKSKSSGWKKPSFCLQLAFLALAVSAFLAPGSNEASADPEAERLFARGWQWVDPAPCENLTTGKFYEIESENESTEFYAASQDRFLAPSPQWPEPPAICREIKKPSFIQEVK